MNFEFSDEQYAFLEEVKQFIEDNRDPEVMDVTRENMSQLVDTPKRRKFMKAIGAKGWLGMTWPEEVGGGNGEGVYEYLLNEELARNGPGELKAGTPTG